MKRRAPIPLCMLAAASVVLSGSASRAAEPTVLDCLAASDASLRTGSEHRLRAERAQLLVCASPTCPAEIRKECTRRVDEVNAAIPTVVFDPRDAAGKDLSDVRVTIDGVVLADRLDGSALPVDPGIHVFLFETTGQAPVPMQLVIREGQKDRHEAVTFGAKDVAPAVQRPKQKESQVRASSRDESESGPDVRTAVTVVASVVAVAGVTTGTVFGLQALSKRDEAQRACPGMCSDQNGVALWSDATTSGTVSTVAFIAGGIGVATAALVWLTAGPRRRAAPITEVGLGPGGIAVKGRW